MENDPADGSDPYWTTFSLLGCAWLLVFILFVVAVIIRFFTKPRIDTFNLSPAPNSFYMLKVRTGAISGGFLSGKYEISLDVINSRNQTLGRVKLPISSSGKPGDPQTVYVKIGTREPFDVGAVRVEHNSYKESVSLENVELRELDGSGKIFRADINSQISFNPGDQRRQTFKAYLDDTSFGTAEFLEPGEDNLSLLDWVFFLFFAINIIMMVSLYVHQHVNYHENYTDVAIGGCVSGIVALALTIALVLSYRLLIKKNIPKHAGFCYIPQVIFFSICIFIAAMIGIAAAVLAALYPLTPQTLTYWGVATAIGLVLFLFLFVPIVLGIEYCIGVVRTNDLEKQGGNKEVAAKQESHGNEYFEAISKKHGSPIRSISQYRRPAKQAFQTPPSKPLPAAPKSPPKAMGVKKQDSTGSEYFHQINRAGVKSISQYGVLKKK